MDYSYISKVDFEASKDLLVRVGNADFKEKKELPDSINDWFKGIGVTNADYGNLSDVLELAEMKLKEHEFKGVNELSDTIFKISPSIDKIKSLVKEKSVDGSIPIKIQEDLIEKCTSALEQQGLNILDRSEIFSYLARFYRGTGQIQEAKEALRAISSFVAMQEIDDALDSVGEANRKAIEEHKSHVPAVEDPIQVYRSLAKEDTAASKSKLEDLKSQVKNHGDSLPWIKFGMKWSPDLKSKYLTVARETIKEQGWEAFLREFIKQSDSDGASFQNINQILLGDLIRNNPKALAIYVKIKLEGASKGDASERHLQLLKLYPSLQENISSETYNIMVENHNKILSSNPPRKEAQVLERLWTTVKPSLRQSGG